MTPTVRHLKIGILHPSNSLPVTFYTLFSGDKYREIDDKYRETRQLMWLLLCARILISNLKSMGI
jgi:hypothetical protein